MNRIMEDTPRAWRWRGVRWLCLAGLLAMPWIAMQFTREVAWTASDFAAMAMLLISAGLAFELLISRMRKSALRIALAALIIVLVAVIWAEGAVGVFH